MSVRAERGTTHGEKRCGDRDVDNQDTATTEGSFGRDGAIRDQRFGKPKAARPAGA